MEILLVGRILKDYYLKTNEVKFGGNVLNVASILAALINPTSIHLISAVDVNDELLTTYINKTGINFYNVGTIKTPLIQYDENNDVIDVDLYDLNKDFTCEKLVQYSDVIKQASVIVCDLGNKEIVEFIINTNPKAYLIIEPISKYNVKNFSAKILNRLSLLKGNRHEIETLTLIKIVNKRDCFLAQEQLKLMGVKRAFITLDKDGAYYFDENKHGYIESKIVTNREIIGAGDAFLAGIIYALRITKDIEILADYGNRQIQSYLKK